PQRADRTRYEDVITTGAFGTLASEPYRSGIDLVDSVVQPVLMELEPVGAKRVRLEYVHPGLGVLLVYATHQFRRREIQLVKALVDEYPARIQHRAHRAVEDNYFLGVADAVSELCSVCWGAHRGRHAVGWKRALNIAPTSGAPRTAPRPEGLRLNDSLPSRRCSRVSPLMCAAKVFNVTPEAGSISSSHGAEALGELLRKRVLVLDGAMG